jgi:feruloyl esterase
LTKLITLLFTFLTLQAITQKELLEVKNYGSNPGKIKMFLHKPKVAKLSSLKQPIVFVLHGCSQSAEGIAKQTQWNVLADKYGFYVVYPQQNLYNNPSLCFNWFSSEDVNKSKGESYSIKEMLNHMISNYPIDEGRVFVYGVSAGAAMSVVLMANFPEIIDGGAILAGGPFMPELTDLQRMDLMFNPKDNTSEKLGSPIKKLNTGYSGNYPKVIIIQGKNDLVVNPKNADLLIKQWSFLHSINDSLTDTITEFNQSRDVTKFTFKNSKEETKVIFYDINKMGHSIPIDPGTLPNQGGEKTMYTVDKDFFSTYFIAKDFGLIPAEEIIEKK